MFLIAFIASLALVWLIICFVKWVKAIANVSKGKGIIRGPLLTIREIFVNKWGNDFIVSIALLFLSQFVLPGVMGMVIALFASVIISIIIEAKYYSHKHKTI